MADNNHIINKHNIKKNNICRICNSENISGLSIGRSKLIKCNNCDIVYLKDIPEQSALNDYYQSDYKISSGGVYENEKRRIFRLPEQIALISTIMKYKQPPATILDVGCDKGFFIDEARRYGFSVSGVEPSETARQYADNLNLDVRSSLDAASSKFDIITMWHSLEHFPLPLEAIKKLRSRLNSEGLLFIRVPAFDSICSKLFKDKWIWFQPENHYFHFSKKSLRFLLNSAGYDVLSISKRRPNNILTRMANRLANKSFGRYFSTKSTFRKKAGRLYEDLTGVELLAVVRMR